MGKQLFVFTNQKREDQLEARVKIGPDFPLVSGHAYCLDETTGELVWDEPATLEAEGVALNLPAESPLIVLVTRLVAQQASGSHSNLQVACLDRRTGRRVYAHDTLPDTASGFFRVHLEQASNPSLTIETSSHSLRLTATDDSAQAGTTPDRPAQPESGQSTGLWAIGEKLGGAIQDALEKSRNDNTPKTEPHDDD
jgi:hypothetical protein